MEYLLFAGLGFFASAANTIFNRLCANKISSLITSVIKSFFILLACFVICVCFGHLPNLYSLTNEQWVWVGVVGIVCAIDWYFYFSAIKKAYLESFAPFETSSILFFSNTLFMIFMFSSVTKGGSVANTITFVLGLLCLLGSMVYAVFNKKLNPKAKKTWVLYSILSCLAMSFSLLIVKLKLSEVPSDVVAFHQMVIVFVVTLIAAFATRRYKEIKQVSLKDYGKFILGAIFNCLLMVFRYQAFSYSNAVPPIINCIISLDYVLVSLATVLFFKSGNKKELVILILMISLGMTLNMVSGLI